MKNVSLRFRPFSNSEAKGPPNGRWTLGNWLVIWFLGVLGLGALLFIFRARSSSWALIAGDVYALLGEWLLAGFALCIGGVMYCVARMNELHPRHDSSTSGFLHMIGFTCMIGSLYLAADALYVTAWQLPRYGWPPTVAWYDRNERFLSDPVVGVAFSPDGTALLARHEKGEWQIWNWHGGECNQRIATDDSPVAGPLKDGQESPSKPIV